MSETGRLISVSKTTLGSVLAAAATAGDGTITVQDTTDFGEQSGTLQIGGAQNDYTSADPATGIITLTGTLAANADEGDRVDVWDTGLGQVAEDVQAQVALPGRLGSDEPITAYIGHALAAFVDQGLRDPGTEEAVTMVQDGDSWLVTDVRGKNARATSAVVTGVSSGKNATSISRTATGPGLSTVTADGGVAVGVDQDDNPATVSAANGTAVGGGATVSAVAGTSVGNLALASGVSAVAVGPSVTASGDGSAAIGRDSMGFPAQATGTDDFVLGTNRHHVSVPGDFGVHGATPVGQSVTPVTLADVIAVLQAHGFCA